MEVCNECHLLGQEQHGDVIAIGLHTPTCSRNSKNLPTSPDPLASIAESLERLADIAEIEMRFELSDVSNAKSIKQILADRITITPKGDNV